MKFKISGSVPFLLLVTVTYHFMKSEAAWELVHHVNMHGENQRICWQYQSIHIKRDPPPGVTSACASPRQLLFSLFCSVKVQRHYSLCPALRPEITPEAEALPTPTVSVSVDKRNTLGMGKEAYTPTKVSNPWSNKNTNNCQCELFQNSRN